MVKSKLMRLQIDFSQNTVFSRRDYFLDYCPVVMLFIFQIPTVYFRIIVFSLKTL